MHALRVSLVVGLLFTSTIPAAASDARPRGTLAFLDEAKGFFTSIWEKTGCMIEPWGACAETPQTKEGCWIDPLGRCVTSPQPGSTADRPDTTGLGQLDRE